MLQKIIPTVFAYNKKDFDKRFNILTKNFKELQIDIMDGKFVTQKSIPFSKIPNLKNLNINFEAHLMVHNPKSYIKKAKNKGFQKIIFHKEATKTIKETIDTIKAIQKENMTPILAITPKTSFTKIKPLIKKIDHIMIMGIIPGKEHQEFDTKEFEKIKKIRKENKNLIIQIDGGVNQITAKKFSKLKVNILNSGSFIAQNKEPKKAYKLLLENFKNNKTKK